MSDSKNSVPFWALVGNPNAGKTALFNGLTGSRQKVANYPGITVERKEGVALLPSGRNCFILDLPGTYSIDAKTPDEEVTKKVVLGHLDENICGLIVVLDACQLERGLVFLEELKSLGYPLVVALNMMDLALKRGMQLDVKALEHQLGIVVIPTVAIKKKGLSELLVFLDQASNEPVKVAQWKQPLATEVQQRFSDVAAMLSSISYQEAGPPRFSEYLDKIILHPVGGFIFLIGLLFLLFQALFSWAEAPMAWIETGVATLGNFVASYLPDGSLKNLWQEGIISGVGSMLVFLPQILILFFFIILLEDTGYMARAAFMMDRAMGRVGLHGRAFVPLLSGHACAIPAIMSTRTIENPRHRLLTMLMIPLTTCSARLPVYALLIAAFIPDKPIGFLNLQGLVMMGLYLAGITSALLVAIVFRKTALKGPNPLLLMELPSYKLPSIKNIALGLYERAKIFIKNAGTIIMALSILLWFLSSYPKAPQNYTEPAINYSFAGRMGHAIEPVLRPLGFDWRIATSLIPSFAAREVMVSALATVYAVGDTDAPEDKLSVILRKNWSLATGLSLIVWYIFAPQCLATFAVIRRESQSLKWTLILFFMNLTLAYVASFLIYTVVHYFWGL